MRRIWAKAVSVTLTLGAVGANAQESPNRAPAVTLGRPVPAASLGRPMAADDYVEPLQPTSYLTGARPAAAVGVPEGSMPLLAPVAQGGLVIGADQPARPMTSSDGSPLPAPMPTPNGPMMTPAPGPMMSAVPGAPCATCGPDYCGSPAMNVFGAMGPGYGGWRSHFYGSAEFLLWWARNANVPALAVTTPVLPTANNPNPGPQTVLFGDGTSGLFPSTRYGGRFGLGYWFGERKIRGIDANFMFLGTATTDQTFASDATGTPNISRPFINAATGANALEIVTGTGFSSGSVRIQSSSSLYGGDINYRRQILGICGCGDRLDAIAGFRYMHLNEALTITENFATLAGAPRTFGIMATQGTVFDTFGTVNNFYGGQFGLIGERHWGRWSLEGMAKVALGVTSSTVNINGAQNVTIGGLPSADPRTGGLLALGSNIGSYNRTAFSVVPEAGLNLGYQLTPRLKLFVGYSFLYWNNVMRPGDQIDTRVDPARIPNFTPVGSVPTTPNPLPTLRRTDYWAQGINFGLQFRW